MTGNTGKTPLDLPETPNRTHRAHRFPGKFHPPLIAKILRRYPECSVIADPLCGSGTTGVEAVASRRDALLVDIDPLSALMSRCKTTAVDPDRLNVIGREILLQAEEGFVEEDGLTADEATEEASSLLAGTRYELPYNVKHWFEPHVIHNYARLLAAVGDCLAEAPRPPRDAVHTVLAGMVRRISKADPDPVSGLEITKVRRRELAEGVTFDVAAAYKDGLRRLVTGYRDLGDDIGNSIVVNGDAREFTSYCDEHDVSPELVITSPPYCNAIEYSRRHRLESEWLGLWKNHGPDQRQARIETARRFFGSVRIRQSTLRELPAVPHEDVQEVTAAIAKDGDGRRIRKANLLRRYFLDAFDWIAEVHDSLQEGGKFCLIVGPSKSYGHVIDTPAILTDIVLDEGFELEARSEYRLTNNKMQFPTDGNRINTETLVVFTKG